MNNQTLGAAIAIINASAETAAGRAQAAATDAEASAAAAATRAWGVSVSGESLVFSAATEEE